MRGGNRGVIRRNGTEVGLRRHSQTSESGETVHHFDDEETVWGSIRPGETARYSIGGAGEVDSRRLIMDVLEQGNMDEQAAIADPKIVHPRIQEDDRIIHDDREWQAVQRQYASRNAFARFVLKEDARGVGAPTNGGSESGGSSGNDPGFTI